MIEPGLISWAVWVDIWLIIVTLFVVAWMIRLTFGLPALQAIGGDLLSGVRAVIASRTSRKVKYDDEKDGSTVSSAGGFRVVGVPTPSGSAAQEGPRDNL